MDVEQVARDLIFDSDDEELLEAQAPRRPRFIGERLDHFADLDDVDFVRRFRLSKRSVL